MAEPAGRGRSTFRLPRVEFDLAALVVGAMTSAAYACFWPAMAWITRVGAEHQVLAGGRLVDVGPGAALRAACMGELQRTARFPGIDVVLSLLGNPGPLARASESNPRAVEILRPQLSEWGWRYALVAFGLLLLWSVFGGALARVYALRKTRDETLGFGDAFSFSFRNLRQFVTAPLFALAAGGLFAGAVLLCGALSGVPAAGPFLQVVAQPAAFLLALVTAILFIGLVVGLPLMTAAVAVERGGSLDAVSRTYSYVWTRPVQFGLSSLVVAAIGGVITAVSDFVLVLGRRLFAAGGAWLDGDLPLRMETSLRAALTYGTPAVPADASALQAVSLWAGWAVFALIVLALRGYVVSYLVGGVVDVYLLLREEVDQVDPSEVFVEGAVATLGDPVPGEPVPAGDDPGASPTV